MPETKSVLEDMLMNGAFTKAEARQFIQQITEFVKRLESKKDSEMEALKQAIKRITDKLASDSTMSHDKLRKEVDKLFVGEKMDKMKNMHSMADMKIKNL